ncbi:MAG: hypothetical protein HY560_13995 [Gemmatimonadetes bacterium]|nr:hypothetical protein [Gemmatimonadota bacterium]
MKTRLLVPALLALAVSPSAIWSQTSALISSDRFKAIVGEASGELAMVHFRNLLAYDGFSPSEGADQTAEYLAARAREAGLTNVRIDRFPADGKITWWAFTSTPAWDAKKGELRVVEPTVERLASYHAYKGSLGRYSRSAKIRAALVDVGAGTRPGDYEGKEVRGKIALASGGAGPVHEMAVWSRGAAGVVVYPADARDPDILRGAAIPAEGPNGEAPAFAFAVSHRLGRQLAQRLAAGERLTLEADIEAASRPGAYPQVHATIPGTEPQLPEVWIQAHSDYRNSGGGNNLKGTGATAELARVLSSLIQQGALPRPRRNIHFTWGAEHNASMYYVFRNPDVPRTTLAMLNLDMVGESHKFSSLRLNRTFYSLPSFINDLTQEMFEIVAAGNTSVLWTRTLEDGFTLPILAPTGSRDQFIHQIDAGWGPSDHQDVGDGSIGIPGVLFNDHPDPFLGTSYDTPDKADPTQMKRAIVIAGAAAWLTSAAGSQELPALAQNALQKARARLAREERRAADVLSGASPSTAGVEYREAQNIVRQGYRREAQALQTLQAFALTREDQDYVSAQARDLGVGEAGALERLRQHGLIVGKRLGVPLNPAPPESGPAAKLVPVRNPALKGPLSQAWLATKDPRARDLRLTGRGGNYLYEALNFANGQRNLWEIRDLVAAEYGPAPLAEVEEYFRVLEKAGALKLTEPAAPRRVTRAR